MTQDPLQDGSQIEIPGQFWKIDTPDRISPGKAVCPSWATPILHLSDEIIPQRATQTTRVATRITGDPDDIVEDFRPVTIHGHTHSGEKVTVLGAQGGARDFGARQEYRAKYVLVGGHFPDDETTFSSLRFQLDNSFLWSHLAAQPRTVESSHGRLSLEGDTGDFWFAFTPETPMTLRDHGRRTLTACRSLIRLALQKELVVGRVQIRQNEASDWVDCYSVGTASHRVGRYLGNWLIPPRAISLQHFCDWLAVSAGLDGLDAAVADGKFGDVLELRPLVLGTIAEGLHRRLFQNQVRFEGLGPANRKTVRKAGKEAISAAINGFGFNTTPEDFNGLVGPLNDITLKDRLKSLSDYATEAVPTVVEAFDDWPGLAANVRNYIAHWLLKEDVAEVPSIDKRLLIYMSLPWVLRTVLLHRANIDQSVMREGYRENDEYPIYLANVRSTLARL